jgi:uncharacterized protein (DUF1501 family)
MPPNRRAFLHHLQALGSMLLPVMGPQSAPAAMPLAGQLARLGALAALGTAARGVGAQGQGGDGDGYRAIVCLFLGGGNDAHNTLVPTDAASHASYSAPRRTLALPLMKLLPLATTGQDSGRTFGVPKELAPLLRWYNAGQCAFVANIGTLERPITQADVRAGRYLPRKLYSHNDQASVWQSGQPEGAPSGWGGRMGDLLMAQNAWPALTAVSVGGNVAFLNGRTLNQYRISPSGPVQVNAAQSGWHAGSTATPTGAAQPAGQRRRQRLRARIPGHRAPIDGHHRHAAGRAARRRRARAAHRTHQPAQRRHPGAGQRQPGAATAHGGPTGGLRTRAGHAPAGVHGQPQRL